MGRKMKNTMHRQMGKMRQNWKEREKPSLNKPDTQTTQMQPKLFSFFRTKNKKKLGNYTHNLFEKEQNAQIINLQSWATKRKRKQKLRNFSFVIFIPSIFLLIFFETEKLHFNIKNKQILCMKNKFDFNFFSFYS